MEICSLYCDVDVHCFFVHPLVIFVVHSLGRVVRKSLLVNNVAY